MEVDRLNEISQEMEIYDLLLEIADSPEVKAMAYVPVESYDEQILKTAGHPDPFPWMRQLLRVVSNNPSTLSNTDKKSREANEAVLNAHRGINVIINLPPGLPTAIPPAPPGAVPQKPKRRKLFTGLGKLFSGLALLSGNAIVAPTVPMGVTALPVIGSFAGGVAAVTEGVGQLLREGD